MRKKIFTFLLALVAGIGNMWAQNPSGTCGTDLTWEFNPETGVLAISGTGTTMTSIGWVSGVWNEQVTSVTFPESLTSIEVMSAFQGFGMSTITLPENLTVLGMAAFYQCGALTSIEIPAGVSTIQGVTFSQCSSLATVKLPASITSIADYAFADCPALTSFYSYAETPPTCESNKVFWDQLEWKPLDLSAATLYVPYSSIADYEAANGWNSFGTIAAIPGTEPASSVTAARFVYNYDCQRSPGYPQQGSPCTLSGFKAPYVGYNGIGRDLNTPFGPWKLEFVAYYTPSNNYGCQSVVTQAVNQYYSSLSSQEKEAKRLEVPIFRLWQYNIVAGEYQHAAYGIVYAYAAEGNAEDHGALFISSTNNGCFLAGKPHNAQISLSCGNDLTTGLNNLVTAASATDPDYDAYMPVILSIDAIGTVELTRHCKDFIEGSINAYNALTDAQKGQVTNYQVLVDAKNQWAPLVAEAKPYADAVVGLINAIPNPIVYTQSCKNKIDAAQNAYDALTDGQKMFVSNYETLKNAPSDLIKAAPYVHILFKANDQERKVENVTLPREFTAAEITTMLKEMYNVEGDYSMYASSNSDAVNISYGKWTISPFMGKVNVNGYLDKFDPETGLVSIPFSLEITLDLPPFGPTQTPVIHDSDDAATIETFLNTNNGTEIAELTIDRPVLNNMYNTLCLPFDMDAAQIAASSLNGVEIYELEEVTVANDELFLGLSDPKNAIVAGRPYIVKYSAASQLDDLDFENVTINNADLTAQAVTMNGVTFKGTFTPFVMGIQNGFDTNGGYLFLGQNNVLYWPNTNNPLKPFRAYFYIDLNSGSGNAPLRFGMPARIGRPASTPTGVENVQSDKVQSTKVIENGQLYIKYKGTKYNAQGQKIEN